MDVYAKLLKLTYKIENNSIIASIRRGFILLIPIFLIGAFSVLIKNFPIPEFQNWTAAWAGGIITELLDFLFDATVGFMSVYLVMSISYYYSGTMKIKDYFLKVIAMVISMACFMILFRGADGTIEFANFGSIGVFTAIFAAIAATKLFYYLYSVFSEGFRFHARGSDLDYRNSFSTIIPLFLCMIAFIVLNLFIKKVFHQDNLNELITNSIVRVFNHLSGELPVGALYIFVLNLLWVFGIHGGNAMDTVAQVYLVPADASAAIISKSFLDNFSLIGGCGTSICLVFALLLFTKGKGNRQLACSAAPAIFFNINEILVYGLPVVLNPVMVIPFILTPLCALFIAYGATVLGIIPVVMKTVTWTTPVFFSGYLATGTINGVLVQLVIIAAGTVIYAPFVKISDQIRRNQAKVILDELTDEVKAKLQNGEPLDLLDRHDSLGVLAKNLVAQLRIDVEEEKVPLGYQPQYYYGKGMAGAEALMRWKYMDQNVYPPLVVALAQEDGFYDRLTWCIMKKAMGDCSTLIKDGKAIKISVNVTAEQLNDIHFIDMTIKMAADAGIQGYFCLEVTEETSIDSMITITANISRLKKNGIIAAVDDFSMGKTSLKYLKDNSFDIVKLDGELVRQITENERIRGIIASIINLGQKLDFEIIAEFVENEKIRDQLHLLGCDLYQGYLYSPAVPFEQLRKMQ